MGIPIYFKQLEVAIPMPCQEVEMTVNFPCPVRNSRASQWSSHTPSLKDVEVVIPYLFQAGGSGGSSKLVLGILLRVINMIHNYY